MKRTKIISKIKEILKKSDYYFLQNLLVDISEDTRLIEDMSMDSIQIMEFLVDIEEALNIRFDFSEFSANDIENIGSLINMIENYTGIKNE